MAKKSKILSWMMILCSYLIAVNVQAGGKLSVSQYRILDGTDSYGYTSVSSKYSTDSYRAKLNLPYISGYRGNSGLGNASIKLTYLSQWQNTFIDFNYRQKLATADKRLTVPARDTSTSIELSRYLLNGIVFAELGYTWRNVAQANLAKRKDGFYYSLGGIYPLIPKINVGIVLDHKPTALGQLDQSATLIAQYKMNQKQRLSMSFGAGLSSASPDYLLGLAWSTKF